MSSNIGDWPPNQIPKYLATLKEGEKIEDVIQPGGWYDEKTGQYGRFEACQHQNQIWLWAGKQWTGTTKCTACGAMGSKSRYDDAMPKSNSNN